MEYRCGKSFRSAAARDEFPQGREAFDAGDDGVENFFVRSRKSLEEEGVKPPAKSKSRKKAAASPAKKRSAA